MLVWGEIKNDQPSYRYIDNFAPIYRQLRTDISTIAYRYIDNFVPIYRQLRTDIPTTSYRYIDNFVPIYRQIFTILSIYTTVPLYRQPAVSTLSIYRVVDIAVRRHSSTAPHRILEVLVKAVVLWKRNNAKVPKDRTEKKLFTRITQEKRNQESLRFNH